MTTCIDCRANTATHIVRSAHAVGPYCSGALCIACLGRLLARPTTTNSPHNVTGGFQVIAFSASNPYGTAR